MIIQLTNEDKAEKMNTMKENLHQKAAEKTLKAIIEASEKLFVEKGFAGTSIGSIAKEAGINQSLIYHYFKDKKELWREVKSGIISKTLGDEHLKKAPSVQSLDELLDHLVTLRLHLYSQSKNLIRMLLWQALEDQTEVIGGTSEEWLESWMKQISLLQKQKKMNRKWTPYEVMISLNAVVWAPFITGAFKGNIEPFCQKKVKELKELLS